MKNKNLLILTAVALAVSLAFTNATFANTTQGCAINSQQCCCEKCDCKDCKCKCDCKDCKCCCEDCKNCSDCKNCNDCKNCDSCKKHNKFHFIFRHSSCKCCKGKCKT